MTNDRESVVRAVVEAFHQAFDEGFTGPADCATEDWNHISPNGGATRSREETLRTVRAAHKSFLKGVTATVKTMDVRFASDEVAVATVVSTSSAVTAPDGVKHAGGSHSDLRRGDAQWSLADHAGPQHDDRAVRTLGLSPSQGRLRTLSLLLDGPKPEAVRARLRGATGEDIFHARPDYGVDVIVGEDPELLVANGVEDDVRGILRRHA